MRDAINNNPVVQIAVIGVLVVVVGLFFMMNMKKGGSSSSSSSSAATAGATSSPSTPGTTAPVTSGASSATPAAPSSSSAGSVSVTGGTVTPAALVPGPGLPVPVIAAWKRGDAIALLIVRGGGIDDRLVRGSVEGLKRDSGIAVFVTRAKSVARYSRITQGVGVDRAPALVIVRPHKESGSVPEATVRYGFRSSASVLQAVHDALYNGPDDLPYSPR